jgi:hypothetical protein
MNYVDDNQWRKNIGILSAIYSPLPPLLVSAASIGTSRLYRFKPPLLVQRCNGTTAGLGYLEVKVICPCKSPHWAVD